MGRLPDFFSGRRITYREPFLMEGYAFVESAQVGFQFPAGTFTHASDKPFEIHRMIPRIVCVDENENIVDEDVNRSIMYLLGLVRAQFYDLGKTMQMLQQSSYLMSMVKGTSELTWEFAEPMYLAKSELFQITLDVDTFPAGFADDSIDQLRVHIAFEGFQLITKPADN